MGTRRRVRALLRRAASPYSRRRLSSAGVVVSYTTDPDVQPAGKKLALPACKRRLACRCSATNRRNSALSAWACSGLDKLHDPARTITNLAKALDSLA